MTSKITVDEHGCWIWKGCLNSRGYGCVSVNGKVVLTHRRAYELLVGPIPYGLTIDHAVCQVKACCNPQHLEPVTNQVNVQRSRAHITHCPKGHEYTPDNIVWNHGTRRNCRECARAAKRAWAKAAYAKKKAALTERAEAAA